jgi:alkanesulfonate monooxygenase SsuD/methylene tetrahydromethanopterin reductase-like flavin-dependent oxidoreductase (luciferase family)
MPSGLNFGMLLPTFPHPDSTPAPTWAELASLARWAEGSGFDTVWTCDEIGAWECLSLTGAVAASTSTIKVGTWVLSALQRNPATIAAAAETLDDIAGGRFVLGLGSGHPGEADHFGFATDRFVSRYAEAVEIVVPLLRGREVNFDGAFHRATNAKIEPRGPRPGRVPLLMGGLGPRTMQLAARHADIWSCYATTSSDPASFVELSQRFDRECEYVGRDPRAVVRSVGVIVDTGLDGPKDTGPYGTPITGSTGEIIDTLAGFIDVGFTRVEFWWGPTPPSLDAIESLGPIVAALA